MFKKDGTKHITCHTEDMDVGNNCLPVNCEEKYFGKRNFFNPTRNECEVATNCKLPKVQTALFALHFNRCHPRLNHHIAITYNI